METTKTIERGCGQRQPGGVYLESGSEFGTLPISSLIADPVVPVDIRQLNLTAKGQKLLEEDGVTHVADIVGSTHYPNAADFIMEAVHYGVSRRASSGLDFSSITPESMLLLLHSRAILERKRIFADQRPKWECILHPERHDYCEPTCAGTHWVNVLPGHNVQHDLEGHDIGLCSTDGATWTLGDYGMRCFTAPAPHIVTLPCGLQYVASPLQQHGWFDFSHGVIMRCPISRIVLVDDPENSEHIKRIYDRIAAASVPVAVVPE